MCGRFTHRYTWCHVHALMRLTTPTATEKLPSGEDVKPTQIAPVVRQDPHGNRTLDLLRWGLIPFWADDPKIGSRLINARSEEAANKPSFRAAYRCRRCLIPVTEYYEWQKLPDEYGRRSKQIKQKLGHSCPGRAALCARRSLGAMGQGRDA